MKTNFTAAPPRREEINFRKLALRLCAAAVMLLVAGCRAIEFSQTAPDGKTTRVRMFQAFTSTDAYTCDLTPVSARLTAVKSGVDGKALGVAVGVAVKTALTP